MPQIAKVLPETVEGFLQAARDVVASRTHPEFYEAMRDAYLMLHHELAYDSNGAGVGALREAFSHTRADPAVRIALELCALPIYEKPVLPNTGDAPSEFLWIFALPLVIRFPEEVCGEGPFIWEQSPLPAEDILQVLGKSGRVNETASLRMFTKPYTRSDIFAWGPENTALQVLNSELAEAECPFPLPVHFSTELTGYRSVMFMALCAARMPVGSKTLLRPRDSRADLDLIEELIAARLQMLNIPYEEVTVAPPCPLTASCFVSNPAFLQQVSEICEISREAWDLREVYVKFPMPGYVEIAGQLKDGSEVVLMPAELCCEPRKAVRSVLESVIQAAGLPVSVSRVSIHSRNAQVH